MTRTDTDTLTLEYFAVKDASARRSRSWSGCATGSDSCGNPGKDIGLAAWRGTGIDRLLAAPRARSADAIPGMRRLADRIK
jgi:hypothetical protein